MLQSINGLVLGNGQWMNANKLEHYLAWLDNCDKDKAKRLLYPDDPQDVPQAIELMCAITRLGCIDPTKPPYTPSANYQVTVRHCTATYSTYSTTVRSPAVQCYHSAVTVLTARTLYSITAVQYNTAHFFFFFLPFHDSRQW